MLNRLSGRRSQTGQGQTEYILIAALIVVVLIVAYGSFGDEIREQVAVQTSEITGTSKEKGGGTSGGSSGSSQDSPKNPTSNDGKEGKDTPGGGSGVGAGTGPGGPSGGGASGTEGGSLPSYGGGSGGTGGSGSSGSSGGGAGGTGGSGSSGSSGGGSGGTGGSGSSGSSGGGSSGEGGGGSGGQSSPGGPGKSTPPVPPTPTPPPTATPTPTPPPAVAPPAPEPSVWTRACYGMQQQIFTFYPPRPVEIDCGTQAPATGYYKEAIPINGESFKDQYGTVKRAPNIEYDYCLSWGGACIGCMHMPVQCSSNSWSWQKCNQYGECRYIISPVYPRYGY